VVLRLGNHDVELALAEVQAVLRQGLGQPPEVAQRLLFQRGDAPWVLEVGGARVLLAHGEQHDSWNKVDYEHLPGPGAPDGADAAHYHYSAGSLLVKKLLNPLKRRYGMRFADLLMPDFQGALLAAFAINPGAVRLVFQESSLRIGWQLLRRDMAPLTFGEEEAEPDLGLAERVKAACLTEEEQQALEEVMGQGPLPFGDDDAALLSARQKLGRSALQAYSRLHRLAAGDSGERYFDLAPMPGEWAEARRLAQKYQAGAVLIGHTHAARWKQEEGLLYVNSGTWIELMRLPSPEAPDAVWADFLRELQHNPRLDPAHQRLARVAPRFTAVVCSPHAQGGAEVSLVEWQQPSGLQVLSSTRVTPAPR